MCANSTYIATCSITEKLHNVTHLCTTCYTNSSRDIVFNLFIRMAGLMGNIDNHVERRLGDR
jgi:hypothetical protein